MSVEILSRIQFALTILFHFMFPLMTIGLGLVLVIMQTLRLSTGNPVYFEMAWFWTKIFGLIFGISIPLVLTDTATIYHVFREKVKLTDESY